MNSSIFLFPPMVFLKPEFKTKKAALRFFKRILNATELS